MLGDFNDILHTGEKFGGPTRSEEIFRPFTYIIRDCDMTELKSLGKRYEVQAVDSM